MHAGPLGSDAALKLCNNLMTDLGFLAASDLLEEIRAALELYRFPSAPASRSAAMRSSS